MVKIIGVRFRDAGKVYYFDPKSFEISAGGHVIVETSRGVEYGTAVGGVREVADDKVVQPLKEVIRIATEEDDARAQRNREREKEAMRLCREKIQKHGLEMKLIDAEYTFDNSKILFYFTADGRIDFRELVKDLASVFRTRIELRQVGVRDETRLLGGIGICGRELCCHSFLPEFEPVSIRMAKEQNLSLNPTKISGICGRLMCCLKNEEDTYEYLNSRLPGQGDTVTTADGRKGVVQNVNVLRQRVKVIFEEGEEKELEEFDVADLQFHPRRRREKPQKNSHKNKDKGNGNARNHAPEAETEEEKELRELEALDHKDSKSGSEGKPRPRRN
ncbi:MAG: stage 0 sporulation family protein [Clostridiales bacterium]|nr:stage 0 sporulation family protein [Clostridiales bacterium]